MKMDKLGGVRRHTRGKIESSGQSCNFEKFSAVRYSEIRISIPTYRTNVMTDEISGWLVVGPGIEFGVRIF